MYELLKTEARLSKRVVSSNQLRKEGFVPAVIFGKELGSLPIKVEENNLRRCLAKAGQILELEIDGGKKHLVNIDSIERNVTAASKIIHVSFLALQKGKKTTMTIPLLLVGEAIGAKEEGVVNQLMNEIEITGIPQDICDNIEVDITELELNSSITVADLKAPKGLEFSEGDLEKTVVNCSVPKLAEEEPVAAAEGEEGEAAEGEAAEGEAAPAAEGDAAPAAEEKK